MNKYQNIAVIGLGSMGYGIAMSLLRAGHTVYGFDISAEKIAQFSEQGGKSGSVESVAPNIHTAIIVVLNANQTESVLFGSTGIVRHMKPESCVLSCSTLSPAKAQQFAERCESHHLHYLDAPISGGSVKAGQGKLSVMAAGKPSAFCAAQVALDAISENVFNLGDEVGSGSAMKSVNQLLAGAHIACMAEAVTLGMKQGIPLEHIVEVITASAGNSWMFENRSPHIVSGDYAPHSAVDIWLKDLGIVLDIAKTENFDAPMTRAALNQFVAASEAGLGGEDDAAVAKVYAKQTGISLPGEK